MIFKILQGDLSRAVQVVQKGGSTHSTLPILTGIKIDTNKDFISLRSTDLEVSVATKAPAKIKKPGAAVISGRLLADIVKQIPEGAVEIGSDEQTNLLTIKADGASFKIKTMPPEDFPSFPEVGGDYSFELDGELLQEMIKQTSRAVSRDETRPVLTGALLDIASDSVRMVATDSYRLAFRQAPKQKTKQEEISLLLPLRSLEEMAKILGFIKGAARMSTDKNLVKLELGETILVTRILEGQFPNYSQLIPQEHTLQAEVSKTDMAAALNRVALLAQKNMSIKMAIDANKIKLEAATQGVGEAIELVKATVKGEGVGEMAFNAQYLSEGLQAAPGEKIIMQLTGSINPCLIKSKDTNDYLYLVMPIRIN